MLSARDGKRPTTPPEPYPLSDEDHSRPIPESPPSMSSVLATLYRDRGAVEMRHRPPSPIESPPASKGPRTPPSPKPNLPPSPRSKRPRTPPLDFDNPPSKRRRSRDRDVSRDRRRGERERDRYEEKRPRSPPR